MIVWAQSSQRSTWPPSAAVRQLSIADITFNWPRLTCPALASRHAGPWARKMSATSKRGRVMRRRSGGRRLPGQVQSQALQGTGDVADRVDGDAGVERRRLELGVAEQHLNDANIDVLLEQVGGEAVPQRMRRDAFGDPRRPRRGVHGAHDLAGGHRVDRVLPREQPRSRPRCFPPAAKQFQQLWGEHDEAITLSLALFDP